MAVAEAEDTRTGSEIIDELRAWLDDNWDPDLTVEQWWEKLGTAGLGGADAAHERLRQGRSRAPTRSRSPTRSQSLRRARRPGRSRPAARGADHRDPRQPGTDRHARARHRHRPEGVVSALLRARRRFRPRRPHQQGHHRRRRVDHQRPEGVDVDGPDRRHGHAARPHQPRRAEAPGHQLDGHRHAPARHGCAPAQGDDRPRHVQRSVHERSARARRSGSSATLNNGWAAANTTLANERAGLGAGGGGGGGGASPGTISKQLGMRAGDFAEKRTEARSAARPKAEKARQSAAQLLIGMAKGNGKSTDADDSSGSRQAAHARRDRSPQRRAPQGRARPRRRHPRHGQHLQAQPVRDRAHVSATSGLAIVGAAGHAARVQGKTSAVNDKATGNPFLGMITMTALYAQAPPIYGGTDQIQRNIIGERALGLPKEPGPDSQHAVLAADRRTPSRSMPSLRPRPYRPRRLPTVRVGAAVGPSPSTTCATSGRTGSAARPRARRADDQPRHDAACRGCLMITVAKTEQVQRRAALRR